MATPLEVRHDLRKQHVRGLPDRGMKGGQYGRVTRSHAAGPDPAGDVSRTQQSYLATVRGLAKYYHQRPDTLSEAQVQAYVRYLIEQRQLAPSSVRVAVMGLRFFYTQTLHRPWTNLPLPKRTKTLPEVLSREEVAGFWPVRRRYASERC